MHYASLKSSRIIFACTLCANVDSVCLETPSVKKYIQKNIFQSLLIYIGSASGILN